MTADDPWEVLGIAETADASVVRRAYSSRLKLTQPEDDPAGFQRLRAAYELALAMCQHRATTPGVATSEEAAPSMTAAPQLVRPASRDAASPRPAEDPQSLALESALIALARSLEDSPNHRVEHAEHHLRQLMSSSLLERFDLQQRAEERIAQILLDNTPRSEPLLPGAIARFGWASAEVAGFRPRLADAVVHAEREATIRQHLEDGNAEDSRAFQRLAAPPRPWQRLWHAYGASHSRIPEIEVIERLEHQYPAILGSLDPRNLDWWDRCRGAPHLSLFTVGMWIVIGIFVSAWFHAEMAASGSTSPGWVHVAMVFGAIVALGTYRVFVLDWPAILVQRHWYYRLPSVAMLGWLPLGVALMFVALAACGWPVLAWFVASLAALVATWATILGGPTRPVMTGADLKFPNSRLLRIAGINALALTWIATSMAYDELKLTPPVLVAILAALVASATSRRVAIDAVAERLTSLQRRIAVITLGVAAVALSYVLLEYQSETALRPVILVAVLGCVILRRALPFASLVILEMPKPGIGPVVLFLFLFLNLGRGVRVFENGFTSADIEDVNFFVVGGVMMIAGVVVSVVRELQSRWH